KQLRRRPLPGTQLPQPSQWSHREPTFLLTSHSAASRHRCRPSRRSCKELCARTPEMARTAKSRDLPPPLELQCLKALWVLGEGNVREVREYLLAERNLAYTTVMTVLDRLVRRGGVQRRKAGRSFIYSPL